MLSFMHLWYTGMVQWIVVVHFRVRRDLYVHVIMCKHAYTCKRAVIGCMYVQLIQYT